METSLNQALLRVVNEAGSVVSGWRPLGKVISAMFERCGSGAVMSPACKRGLI